MTCPPGCTCPESMAMKNDHSNKKSRYFTGMSPAVIFVASLSGFAFLSVVLAASVVASIQAFFFFGLPLASAAGGAFLIVSPETTVLGSDPAVALLVRAVGAIALAYAGGAMLVGRSGCPKSKSMHLTLVAAALGSLTVAFSSVDTGSALAEEMSSEKAAVFLGRMTVAAVTGAIFSAAGPRVKKKLQSGKPGEPAVLCVD